jgi:hypothetical protein
MTVDITQPETTGKSRRRRPGSDEVPIGEADENIFECPSCRRPLSVGTHRCPTCRTHIIAGIRVSKAAGFIAIGLFVGSVLGGGTVGVLGSSGSPAAVTTATTGTEPLPSTAALPSPVAPATAVPSASGPAADPAVPATAIGALRQTAILNQRIVDDAARLAAALAVKHPTTADIAPALRALSADASVGARLVPGLAPWAAAADVSEQLGAFYDAVGTTARDGLEVSLQYPAGYVSAGRRLLKVVDGLADIDASSRELAGAAGVELPPIGQSDDTTP